MNLQINPGAALDDAQQIDSIVTSIQESMAELDAAMKAERDFEDGKCFSELDAAMKADTTEAEWADKVKSNWNNYYNADVANGMNDMKLSATNLRTAVQQAMDYSMER